MQQVLAVLPGKLFRVAAAITGAKFLLKKAITCFLFYSLSLLTYLQSSKQMGEYSSLLNNRCLTTPSVSPAVKGSEM